jgi:hypothetical protein
VFHQRYSTNTHPSWRLAHPFRFLAHNGEINTVRGNREAMRGRSATLGGGVLGRRLASEVAAGRPLLDPEGSDSASLDEAAELMVAAGWPLDAALLALIREAPDLRSERLPGLDDWQTQAGARVEPWDGPAALVFGDGERVGCVLDRNGLRPATAEVRRDGLVIVASEAGLLDVPPAEIVRRARLDPGALLLVDTAGRRVLDDAAAKADAFARVPRQSSSGALPRSTHRMRLLAGGSLLRRGRRRCRPTRATPAPAPAFRPRRRTAAHRRARDGVDGKEPTWSMGDDTPLAVLANRPRAATAYLRQSFAQVTNPPIDPTGSASSCRWPCPWAADRASSTRCRRGRPPWGGRCDVRARDVAVPGARAEPGRRSLNGVHGRVVQPCRTHGLMRLSDGGGWPDGLARYDRPAGRGGADPRQPGIACCAARRPVPPALSDCRSPTFSAVGAVHEALTDSGLRGAPDINVDAATPFDRARDRLAHRTAAGASAVPHERRSRSPWSRRSRGPTRT